MENKTTYIIIGIIAVLIFGAIVAVVLLGDNDKENVKSNSTNTTTLKNQNTKNESKNEDADDFDYEQAAENQMKDASSGETVAIMHVKDYGDIKFKFFKDKAPKAVENFLTHAKNGYYDGLTFHRVMEEFMIQGGDPKGDGTGGESIWGEGFGVEYDQSLVPYRGALCMAQSSLPNSIGSQFFIVQANPDAKQASQLRMYELPESLVNCYEKYGGYLSLYGSYTVFGQVIEGMDTVDKIAKTEKTYSDTGELSQPVNAVVIESIDVQE